jgi:Dehydrogenase E1 component
MLLVRRFEERLLPDHGESRIPATLYPSTGQEAIGVGVGAALRDGDIVRSWVRGIAQAIGRRMPLDLLSAEMLGKATGVMEGRGGVQFLGWPEGGYLGGCGVRRFLFAFRAFSSRPSWIAPQNEQPEHCDNDDCSHDDYDHDRGQACCDQHYRQCA